MAVVIMRAPRTVTQTTRRELAPTVGAPDAVESKEISTEAGTAAGASTDATASADGVWAIVGLIIGVVGIIVGTWMHGRSGHPTFARPATISEFAILYILAQALERLTEFVSYVPLIGMRFDKLKPIRNTEQKLIDKAVATSTRDQGKVETLKLLAQGPKSTKDGTTADEMAKYAANCQHDLDVIRSNRAVVFFGLLTAVAAVAVGYFDMLFLRMVGVTGLDAQWDIAVTALAIGAGTKPLHDLIANIQKAKEQKEDSATLV